MDGLAGYLKKATNRRILQPSMAPWAKKLLGPMSSMGLSMGAIGSMIPGSSSKTQQIGPSPKSPFSYAVGGEGSYLLPSRLNMGGSSTDAAGNITHFLRGR